MAETQRNIRVDDETWVKVQGAAEKAGCSVNAYVNRLLAYCMAHPHPEFLTDAPVFLMKGGPLAAPLPVRIREEPPPFRPFSKEAQTARTPKGAKG